MGPNPYAPAAEPAGPPLEDEGVQDTAFDKERRPVLLCLLLTFITGGIYSAIWLLRRQPFVDSFKTTRKLGTALPIAVLVLDVINRAADMRPRRRTDG